MTQRLVSGKMVEGVYLLGWLALSEPELVEEVEEEFRFCTLKARSGLN